MVVVVVVLAAASGVSVDRFPHVAVVGQRVPFLQAGGRWGEG